MKVIFDAYGDNYSIMRVQAPVGHMLQYTLLPEHKGVPADLVHYLKGILTRVGPDGVVEQDHKAGIQVPEFTKTGDYTFVVREESVWDCISLWAGVEGKRIMAEILDDSGETEGDIFFAEGVWERGGERYESPLFLKESEISEVSLVEGKGRLYSNIRLENL